MVFAAIGSGLFDADNVHGLFNEADLRSVATRVAANRARLALGQAAANPAGLNAFARGENGLGELANRVCFRLHEIKGDALGGARADAGQFVERGGKHDDWFGESGHPIGQRFVFTGSASGVKQAAPGKVTSVPAD